MQEKIPYKVIDEDKGYKLIKINSKMHLFYMNSRSSQFMMERDFFDYLDGNSIPYVILCHDTSKNIFYYLKLNKKVIIYYIKNRRLFISPYQGPKAPAVPP